MTVTEIEMPAAGQSAGRTVTRTFRYRLYPTSKQHVALGQMMAAHAEVYNAALQERRDAWSRKGPDGLGTGIRGAEQMAQLCAVREARPDQAVWSFTSQQQTLRRLDKAFAAFFRRVKAGQLPGYPRFRSAARFDSVDFRHGDGLRLTDLGAKKIGKRGARLYVQGVGHVRVWMHRDLPVLLDPQGRPVKGASGSRSIGQVTVKREGGSRRPRWFVVIPVAIEARTLAPTGAVVGIDMATGDNGLAYTSDGQRLDNPRCLHRAADRLAAAQRDLARKERGSKNRSKAVDRVARQHVKVRRSRLDHLHKTAAALIADQDLIAVEALKVANMTRRAKPVPDPDQPADRPAGQVRWLPNGGCRTASCVSPAHTRRSRSSDCGDRVSCTLLEPSSGGVAGS